ncbi:unnamed protein product [Orchesella dallaii]|uniref:Uncharacterized protein n=1 Tax=Orchesella dallaii TaxID=48710 RepID=A0ABP1PNC3_9HEXA
MTTLRDLAAFTYQLSINKYNKRVVLRNRPVVIDGSDLMDYLYVRTQENASIEVRARDPKRENPKASTKKGLPNPYWFGGDWKTYALRVRSFFENLKKCEITPIVIMDGGLSRNEREKEDAKLLAHCVNLQAYHGKPDRPVFLKTVFLEVMVELNIHCFQTVMSSEYTIAFVAKLLGNCFILSSKSDFLLFINNVTIRFHSLKFAKVVSRETVTDQNAGTTNVGSKWALVAEYKVIHQLCDQEFCLKDRKLLPLAAVILENDYICSTIAFKALSTSSHQVDTPSNRLANLMKWLRSKPSLEDGITCLMSLLSEPKRLRSTWIINKIIKMYEGLNGESGVWLAIQKKLDTSAWTNAVAMDLVFSRIPGEDTVAKPPNAKLHCPKDWLPFEPRVLDVCDFEELREANRNARAGTHSLMEEKFRQHTDSLEFKLYLKSLPQWFIDGHTNCEFQPYLLNIVKNRRMTLNAQVERWESENCHNISHRIIRTTATILLHEDCQFRVTCRKNQGISSKKLHLLSPTELDDIGGHLPTMYFKGFFINNQFKEELKKIITINSDTESNNVSKPKNLAIIEEVLFGANLAARIYVQAWPEACRIWIACLIYYVDCGNGNIEKREVMSVALSILFCIIKFPLVNPGRLSFKRFTTEQMNYSPLARYQRAMKEAPEKLNIVREFYHKHERFFGVTGAGAPLIEPYDLKIFHAMSEYQCMVFHTNTLNSLLDKPYKPPNVRYTLNNFLMCNLAHVFLPDLLPTGPTVEQICGKLFDTCKVQELLPIVQEFFSYCT